MGWEYLDEEKEIETKVMLTMVLRDPMISSDVKNSLLGLENRVALYNRLRDITGELRRPSRHFEEHYGHLLRDDGRLDPDEQLRIMQLLLPPQHRSAKMKPP